MSDEDTRQPLGTTPPSEHNLAAFSDLFPGVIREGVLDTAQLAGLLGVDVGEIKRGKEVFGLSWAGKKSSSEALQLPSYAALVPDFEKSINWDSAENVFIEGDNLEVLKLLRDTYNDKIKMIYIDPPYNTGNDFVYNDDFSDPKQRYLEITGQVDSDGNRLTANPETSGRKHSNWLNMMYPRLKLARNLLSEDGLLLISIDDNELDNLVHICREIFGESNALGTFIWKKKGTSTNVAGAQMSSLTEYIVAFARNASSLPLNSRVVSSSERDYPRTDDLGAYRTTIIEKKSSGDYDRASMKYEILGQPPREGKRWQIGLEKARDLESKGRFILEKGVVKLKIYEFEDGDSYSANPNLLLEHGSTQSGQSEVDALLGGHFFDNPKPSSLIQHFVSIATREDSIVMDFFAGSGTTGHAVELQNLQDGGTRRYICVTLNEPTPEGSEARNAGFEKVSQITEARLTKVVEISDGARSRGLRVLRLGPSNYEPYFPDESGLFNLQSTSKSHTYSHRAAAAEVILKQGVELHHPWTGEQQILSEAVLFLGDNVDGFEPSSLEAQVMVVVTNEDAFEAKDDLKAKIHFDLKQMNKKLVTY